MLDNFKDQAREQLIKVDALTMPCRDCREEIWFLKNRSGKLMPMNLGLEIHECPNKERKIPQRSNFRNDNRNRGNHIGNDDFDSGIRF